MPEAVIVSTARSPIGRAFKGSLKDVRPDDLAADGRAGRAGEDPGARPGPGRRPLPRLRRAVGRAGLQHGPRGRRAAPATTTCPAPPSTGSAPRRVQTTRMAFHAIKAGEGDIFICAGVECVSPLRRLRRRRRVRGRLAEPAVRRRRRPQRRAPRPSNTTVDRPARGRPAARRLPGDGPDGRERRRPARHQPRERQDEWGVEQPEPRREGHRRRLLRPRDHARSPRRTAPSSAPTTAPAPGVTLERRVRR